MEERRSYIQQNSKSSQPAKKGGTDPVTHCSNGWFPVNGIHLVELQEKIRQGIFKGKREALLLEVSKDISLFSYCIRESFQRSDLIVEDVMYPLENLPDSIIEEILLVAPEKISTHGLIELPKPQVCRIRQAVVSSTTASILGDKSGVGSWKAFGSSLLRQLGYNLIAWNYPSAYSKALAQHAIGNGKIESHLLTLLGITPDALTAQLIKSWNGGDAIIKMITSNASHNDPSQDLLVKVCSIGESYSRLSDPEHFPEMGREWKTVIEEIDDFLGVDGIDLLNRNIQKSSGLYLASSQIPFLTELSPQKNAEKANAVFGNYLFSQNQFLQKCSQDIKERFKEPYKYMHYDAVSGEALGRLAMQTFPALGFIKGCLYLLEPKSMTLKPSLRIGNSDLSRYKPISVLSGNTAGGSSIAEALYSGIPIREERVPLHDEIISHVSGPFGNNEKGGVLHLEIDEAAASLPSSEVICLFKAAKKAVEDCLNLRT